MATPPKPARQLLHFEAQARSIIALAFGLTVYFLLRAGTPTRIIAAWDSFAVILLALTWLTILTSGIEHIRYRAASQDLSRMVIFVVTITGAFCSIFAVVALLSAVKNNAHIGVHALLSGVAVIASWTLVHTMFSLRYAHIYYGGDRDAPHKHAGGLEFPGDTRPGYLDFAYFSFVIGMTAQVSDVQISSKRLRSLALVHGVLSFCFNTIILALTINAISGLL